jgi:hypothetical protein
MSQQTIVASTGIVVHAKTRLQRIVQVAMMTW